MSSDFYNINYQFTSDLQNDDEKYLTTIKATIFEYDFKEVDGREEETQSLIGQFTLRMVHLTAAMDDHFPLATVIDLDGYVNSIGEDIFDLENQNINEDILEFYKDVIINIDLCIIDDIEIQESHRSKGIGFQVIKNVYNKFRGSCGLFVVEAYPLQFDQEHSHNRQLPDWSTKMNYKDMEDDFEKSFYKLKSFYQKCGFDHIDGYNKLMFLNPLKRNDMLKD